MEKQHYERPNVRTAPRRPRVTRHVLPSLLLLATMAFLFRGLFSCHRGSDRRLVPGRPSEQVVQSQKTSERVALEAHIMSKCPDAKDCLQQLIVPAMANVSDKVDFRLSYIGSVDPDSDDVSCMHGPSECLGNIIQLCAQKVYPEPKMFLGFANCMIADYSDIPERELVEGCAMEHGLDFGHLNHCISEEGHGMDLLRQSMLRSTDSNVTKSCTVRLAGEIRCVRDGGAWSDCPGGSRVEDLTRDIRKLATL